MKQILLPKPDGAYLKTFAQLHDSDYLDLPKQNRATTRLARQHNIPIKWFDDFIGMGILICNPDRSDGWLHIEVALPCVEAQHRQAIRIEKTLQPEAYQYIYEAYKKMWDKGHDPQPSESRQTLGDLD